MLVRWLVFIHVLSAITFFLAHGAAAAMVFKVRSETDFARIRAMLDLSVSTFKAYMLSFFMMGVTGLTMPFLIHIWNRAWIWLSIVLILFVVVWMGLVNEKQIKQLRRLVGLPYMQGFNEFPAETPASPEEVAALLKKINPYQWALVGYGIPAVVLWLMVFKPF
ncbi:MAG TPA: hypothetical protein PLD33_15805 [Anaerolineales bacterium]|nr:hypothetical protein [Anaerolineales bacterium]HNH80109.1 hypothetical protein [Anaerolineales bacterium]HUM26384.1 hypothetical protein [Anaerolineales bacterium]